MDKKLFRPLDVPALQGDFSKAANILGWRPKTSFDDLVKLMVEADLRRWKDCLNGMIFPWDIPSSVNIERENEFYSGSRTYGSKRRN